MIMTQPLQVLIACERSGTVRRAFQALGHEVYSCDLEPAEDGERVWHIVGDALHWSRRRGWDLMIAHPECRFLCNSGVLRLYQGGKKRNGRDPLRWLQMTEAAHFYRELCYAPIRHIAVENSVMHGYAKALIEPHIESWDRQIIQPWQFGADASKGTLLRLKNLPRLTPTKLVAPRMIDGRPRWANQTDSGQNRLGPSPTRSMDRARTYDGIAQAIAEQWSEAVARWRRENGL